MSGSAKRGERDGGGGKGVAQAAASAMGGGGGGMAEASTFRLLRRMIAQLPLDA